MVSYQTLIEKTLQGPNHTFRLNEPPIAKKKKAFKEADESLSEILREFKNLDEPPSGATTGKAPLSKIQDETQKTGA